MNQNGAAVYTSEREAQLSAWAIQYFSRKLTDQGFVSWQNKGLSWYKVVGNNLIQTVYLFSGTSSMLMPELGFGCHPLFISAPLPQKLTVSGYGRDDVVMHVRHFPMPKIMGADSQVMHTRSPEAGAELLDEIVFPHFEGIHTLEDAYRVHRDSVQQRIEGFLAERSWADYNGMAACRGFMDELIYMEDWDMLKYCGRDLSPSLCRNERDRRHVDAQRAAIYDGRRDEFLVMLEKRKKRFVSQLEQKLDIRITVK